MAFSRTLWLAATDAGLLASRDRGTTWSAIALGSLTKPVVHAVRLSPDAAQIWALAAGALWNSADGGKTWTPRAADLGIRGRVRLLQADGKILFVASSNGLYVSRDAGSSWQQSTLRELDIQDLAIRDNVVLVSTHKSGLHISYDRGVTWAHLHGPLAEGYFPALAAAVGSSGFLAASASEGLYTFDLPAAAVVSAAAQPGNRSTPTH